MDAIGKPLVSSSWGDIDPTVYVDSDGQAYLYWGEPDAEICEAEPGYDLLQPEYRYCSGAYDHRELRCAKRQC
ncbi:hypothetical protein ACFTAO_38600 [Paenibacillus rhizoplanae]